MAPTRLVWAISQTINQVPREMAPFSLAAHHKSGCDRGPGRNGVLVQDQQQFAIRCSTDQANVVTILSGLHPRLHLHHRILDKGYFMQGRLNHNGGCRAPDSQIPQRRSTGGSSIRDSAAAERTAAAS